MTSKKTDTKSANSKADKADDVAPYLSTSKDSSDNDSASNSMLTPFILILALAAAIFVIFYGDEFRNLMARVGIDIENPASNKVTSTTAMVTGMERAPRRPDSTMMPASNPPAGSNQAQRAVERSQPMNQGGNRPPAAGTTVPHPYAYGPYPAYPYGYRPYAYAPPARYPDRFDMDKAYDDMLKRHQKMLEEIEQEQAEAEKAFDLYVQQRAQERADAAKAYEQRVQLKKQAREDARKQHEERMKQMRESYPPS